MKVGIVGFAGSGKTTIFNALTGLAAETGFGGKDRANVGVIKVPDSRVDRLGDLYKPKKKTYAEISFVDVAGPEVQTGERSETGLDPKLVQHMREADALVHIVRDFDNPFLARGANAAGDIQAFEDEMMLTDLVQIENRIARLKKERDSGRERDLFDSLKEALESEKPLREIDISSEDLGLMAGFRFLSLKPELLLVNVGEDKAAAGPPAEVTAI
jgi:ribosome-binding ATPase YchF (GTP1/OBG family)